MAVSTVPTVFRFGCRVHSIAASIDFPRIQKTKIKRGLEIQLSQIRDLKKGRK
jgi:hypothetical protein